MICKEILDIEAHLNAAYDGREIETVHLLQADKTEHEQDCGICQWNKRRRETHCLEFESMMEIIILDKKSARSLPDHFAECEACQKRFLEPKIKNPKYYQVEVTT